MKYILITLSLFFIQLEVHSENFEVKMLNQGESGIMVFEPAVLKINVGDTVTFKATDAAHNSASIPGMIPENASAWFGDLSRDITIKFEVPGVYGYQCTPHAMMAMVGVIEVGDDQSNLSEVKLKAQTFKNTFVMNQTRLDDYLSKL